MRPLLRPFGSPVRPADDAGDGGLPALRTPGAAAGSTPVLTRYSSAQLDADPDLANKSCWNWSGAGTPTGEGTSDDWFIESHHYMDADNKCISPDEPVKDPIEMEPFTAMRTPCRVGRTPGTSSCYEAESLAQWFGTNRHYPLPLSRRTEDNYVGTRQMPRDPLFNLPHDISPEQIISCCNPTAPRPLEQPRDPRDFFRAAHADKRDRQMNPSSSHAEVATNLAAALMGMSLGGALLYKAHQDKQRRLASLKKRRKYVLEVAYSHSLGLPPDVPAPAPPAGSQWATLLGRSSHPENLSVPSLRSAGSKDTASYTGRVTDA